MSALTLLILRLAFLAVLWAFIFAVVYALRSDLFGQRVRKQPADAAAGAFTAQRSAPLAPAPVAARAASGNTAPVHATAGSGPAKRLVITSGPKAGLEIDLPAEQLTIGRSNESGLVIRDDYTSTHHARLMLWNDSWVVQDLDSTNGTYLDGVRVSVPTPVPMNATVKIGTTSFELRR
jgi:hypothetical protein